MKNADKDRDPAKARKRATSDFRCAARKLGETEARRALAELFPPKRGLTFNAFGVCGACARNAPNYAHRGPCDCHPEAGAA